MSGRICAGDGCIKPTSFLFVQPGYLHEQLPSEAPQLGEKWEAVMKDVNKCIVPGAATITTQPFLITSH